MLMRQSALAHCVEDEAWLETLVSGQLAATWQHGRARLPRE